MTYRINELYGEAWLDAVYTVMTKLNDVLGTDYFMARDKYTVEKIAYELNLKFDEKGKLITEV